MCLAVPGKVIAIHEDGENVDRIGTVDFQGSRLEISLMLTPAVERNDWVLVHAGFALRSLDEAEAMETWKYLDPEEVEELSGEQSHA
jgi:hydrogenase expression/formation protein HypC